MLSNTLVAKRQSKRNKKREPLRQDIGSSLQETEVEVRQISLDHTVEGNSEGTPTRGVGGTEESCDTPAEVVSTVARMLRNIKCNIFKGTSQNVDDWLEEFDAVADANEESAESKAKMFHGMLRKAALKWYNALEAPIHNNQVQLRERFVTKF
jgi:hypothetical protein